MSGWMCRHGHGDARVYSSELLRYLVEASVASDDVCGGCVLAARFVIDRRQEESANLVQLVLL